MTKDKDVRKGQERTKRKGIGIKGTLLVIGMLPVVVLAVVQTTIAMSAVRNGMGSENLNGLKNLAISTRAAYAALDEGDYYLGDDGHLYKGDLDITAETDLLDSFTEGVDADVTFFWGDTRYATSVLDSETGERAVGTQAAPEVSATVLTGEEYSAEGVQVNGVDYYAYYLPLENSDGSVIGMVFAGTPSADVVAYINEQARTISVVTVIITIIAAIGCLLSAMSMGAAITAAQDAVTALASGNLGVRVGKKALKRKDEIGDIGRAVNSLLDKLSGIIGGMKNSSKVLYDSGNSLDEMAGQSSEAATEISRAVEDISKGAISQAEEIETASVQIGTMGDVIEQIVDGVKVLHETSDMMKSAGDKSTEIIQALTDSNDRTTEAIEHIGQQIRATNESVQRIGEATQLITSIADQTSLLSLNASIEAARAGEAGKGFAVVATEIQKLAEQSNESAVSIQKIIDTLLEESEKTVKIMDKVEVLVEEQQEKLNETRQNFVQVQDGIVSSREDTDSIKGHTDTCNLSREQVMDVISNLSSISEENAASTEETTASMQELNATINLLAEAARNLKELSEQMEADMEFFYTEEQ